MHFATELLCNVVCLEVSHFVGKVHVLFGVARYVRARVRRNFPKMWLGPRPRVQECLGIPTSRFRPVFAFLFPLNYEITNYESIFKSPPLGVASANFRHICCVVLFTELGLGKQKREISCLAKISDDYMTHDIFRMTYANSWR